VDCNLDAGLVACAEKCRTVCNMAVLAAAAGRAILVESTRPGNLVHSISISCCGLVYLFDTNAMIEL
jgi:hypothetical protein